MSEQVNQVLDNRAERTDEFENSVCDSCDESLIFYMKDKHHEFSIGIRDILRCLEFAEDEGAVPEISSEWWIKTKTRYNLF